MSIIRKEYKAKVTKDGAGVELYRVFGYYEVNDFDPFLLLDYFSSSDDTPSPGFPWHPHRGIETISYILRGSIVHEDSLGHKGTIGPTDLQWMTAGSGILHQEMPTPSETGFEGFQFWLNMPSGNKLDPPRYQEFTGGKLKTIIKDGINIKLISGDYEGVSGPIDKTSLGVLLMEVGLSSGKSINLTRSSMKNGYIFVYSGEGLINNKENLSELTAYTLEPGNFTVSNPNKNPLKLIFAEGTKIDEPVAWRGPIVMNTDEEIREAFSALDKGTFIK